MSLPSIVLMVLDRGFVVVGRAELDPDLAFTWRLSPGRTVRRWGTDQGLAQLKTGPRPNTVLDPPCEERIPFRAVLRILTLEESTWEPHLSGPKPAETPARRGR